jgi:hypothetical protein
MSWTDWEWEDLWSCARHGGVYFDWCWPLRVGSWVCYYDGWHFVWYFGFFVVEVS